MKPYLSYIRRFCVLLLAALLNIAAGQAHRGWKEVRVRSKITHVQPMTGLVLWPHQAKALHSEYAQAIQLEFAYCLPCKVVKGCDVDRTIQYDWTWFDRILDDVASRGHQLIARFRYEYPGSRDVNRDVRGATAVPQYIKQRDDYHETFNDVQGDGPTFYADWSCAELQRFTLQFYSDFAARYAHDCRLAFLEVGFGHWSEYHIYGTPLELGRNFPSKSFQKRFFEHMQQVMTDIPWVVGIDAGERRYSPLPDDDSFDAMTFGQFDDSFMHKGHEIGSGSGYNEKMWKASGVRWKQGPCGGEVSYYDRRDQREFLNPDGLYGHTWEEQATKYHMTFVIANDAPTGPYGTATRFASAGMAAGYRFCITECRTNGRQTKLSVTNRGIAPIYRDAYFAIGDARSAVSLKSLLPGDTLTVSIDAPLSLKKDSPSLHIVSDAILPVQQIQYEY